ncbi:MAG: 50S ribosomal protein L29 [Parcubacteria group bacterium]|nr:50S ribosomal protein L29 [Parcubacteria group bacterium]
MRRDTFSTRTSEAARALLKEKQARLQELRFERRTGKLKDVTEIGRVKKEIARLLTHLRTEEKGASLVSL